MFFNTGSAADLCKAAMLQVEHALAKHGKLQAKYGSP